MPPAPQARGRTARRFPSPPPPLSLRRIEPWLVVGAFVVLVVLAHVELLLGSGEAADPRFDPAASMRNEFPNPFVDRYLIHGWEASGQRAAVLVHAVGAVLAGLFLLRVVRVPLAALAGAALYGVHPLRAALLAEGADWPLIAGPAAFFAAALLLGARSAWRPIGALVLVGAASLDPAALGLPVVLALLLWFVRPRGVGRDAVGWSLLGALGGAVLTLGLGLRAWPRLPASGVLGAGAPGDGTVPAFFLTLGRALRHLYEPTFSGVDYGRGEVPLAWAWSDPGAAWLLGVAGGVALLAVAVRLRWRSAVARGVLAAALAGLLLPLPRLAAALCTEEGLRAGELTAIAIVPAWMLASVVKRILAVAAWPAALRHLTAVTAAVAVLLPALSETFDQCARLKTERGAIEAALAVSDRSHRLRRRHAELLLRLDHNKLDLRHRFKRLVGERPRDPRSWAAFGRFYWVLRWFPEAARCFTRALALRPASHRYRYRLAAAQLMAREPERALRTAASLPGATPEVRALRRLAAARAGRPLPSLRIERAPPLVLRAHGMVLAEAGRFEAALPVLERAQAARRSDALIAAYRGWCLLQIGRLDEGEDVLLYEALADESGFLAHKLLGELYLQDGPRHNRDSAFHHLGYFLRYDRDHPEAPRLRRLVKAIARGEK